jgi:hypothetical protein
MRLRRPLAVSAAFVGVALFAVVAVGQQAPSPKQLVGTWTLVSESGGIWGANPKSLLVFTDNGRYSLAIMRNDRAKFTSNNRMQGTPEENKATVQGTLAHFGRYTVNPDGTFSFVVEGSTFPNWNGTEQKRPVTVSADELKYTTAAPSGGGAPTTLVWKRVK